MEKKGREEMYPLLAEIDEFLDGFERVFVLALFRSTGCTKRVQQNR
jgi:hypothetical protein